VRRPPLANYVGACIDDRAREDTDRLIDRLLLYHVNIRLRLSFWAGCHVRGSTSTGFCVWVDTAVGIFPALTRLQVCRTAGARERKRTAQFNFSAGDPLSITRSSEPAEEPKTVGENCQRVCVDRCEFPHQRKRPDSICHRTPNTYLLRARLPAQAIRSGIGVGRDGFSWVWRESVRRKRVDDWIPPAEMLARQPYLPRFMVEARAIPLERARDLSCGTIYRMPPAQSALND